MIIYRMTTDSVERSMWYTREGVFAPVEERIATIPMEYNLERVRYGGNYLSAVTDPNVLEIWFPDGLVSKLRGMGFVMHKYETFDFYELPNEVIFNINTATELVL